MSVQYSYLSENAYASPTLVDEPVAEKVSSEYGSLALIVPGIVLLLVGYFTSNLFAINDLYQLCLGPYGDFRPSPLADVFHSRTQQWMFYALTATAAIGGCLLVGSQQYHPLAVIAFVMCPIVSLVWVLACPLRMTSWLVRPIAFGYMALGTCLAGAGMLRLIMLYGGTDLTYQPLLASLMFEAGLAFCFGSVIALANSGAFTTPPAPPAEEDCEPTQS